MLSSAAIRAALVFLLMGMTMSWTFLFSDVKGTNDRINFDVDSNGSREMILNSTGLGIGVTSPSANLHVQGNAIVTDKINIGGASTQGNLNLQGTWGHGFAQISSNTTLSSHTVYIVDTDTAGGNLNLTLPHPASISGRKVMIKKNNTEHDVHILGSIEGDEKVTLPSTQSTLPHISLISNGNDWYILSQSTENTSGNVVASSNLIHHWKFEDTSGSTATDSVNNADPGTMTSMTFENDSVTGRIGNALEFDGGSDYITIGDMDDIELTELSITFWAKVDHNSGDHDFFVKGDHTTFQPILIWFDNSVGPSDVGTGNTDTVSALVYDGATQHWVAAPSGTLANTDWNHITVVISPTTGDLSIYVNGELEITNNKAWNGVQASADQVRLGSDVNQTYLLNGAMDDVRIYNKVLSASEIREIYQLGAE